MQVGVSSELECFFGLKRKEDVTLLTLKRYFPWDLTRSDKHHGGPLAHQNQPTCIAALSVPPPLFLPPFFILPMGLQIFSPSWYVSCELNAAESSLDAGQKTNSGSCYHFSRSSSCICTQRIQAAHFCANGDITDQVFLYSLVIYHLFFCHVKECRRDGS